MIRFEQASVTYPGGVVAMKDLDLTIEPGEFVVIVGLSGAGKSTLIRAINGLVPLTDGDCTIDGMSVRSASSKQMRELRSHIGMIFQTFNLVKRTSVLNNVLMGRLHSTGTWRSLLGWYKPADVEIAMQGATSEDVCASLPEGRFGMASEPGTLMHAAIREAAAADTGYGEAIARIRGR